MVGGDACKKAIINGLKGIIFTEHLDYGFPDEDYRDPPMKDYTAMIDTLRHAYPELCIGKGIEIGYQSGVIEMNKAFLDLYPFDFVISSVHTLGGLDLYDTYFEGREKEQVYIAYLQEVLASVKNFQNYDVVAHLGYIRRYSPYPDFSMRFSDYTDLIDAILKQIISDGKGLDVNTSGYRMGYKRNLGTSIPDLDILLRYKQLGGEIITIGSDAHKAGDVGSHFGECVEELNDLGFRHAFFFSNRTAIAYDI